MKLVFAVAVLGIVAAACSRGPYRPSASPPPTAAKPVTEALHGVDVVDPYRWLEGDNSNPDQAGQVTPEVAAWTDAQNAYTRTVLDGYPDRAAIEARMAEITQRRETTQPIREKTGGSTFKNPPGHSSWKLVDEAGWRGKPYGGAMFSPLHANFLINTGEATAADLEGLGEAVRADVKAKFGVDLEWEIKRIGKA